MRLLSLKILQMINIFVLKRRQANITAQVIT